MSFKNSAVERPIIDSVTPGAAIAGGDFQIRGRSFLSAPRPSVAIGGVAAPLIVGSNSLVIARVPEAAGRGEVIVSNGEMDSAPATVAIGMQLADSLHPVANPAVDQEGNVYATFSGSRGQKTPVAVYKVDRDGIITPFLTDLMNATGLAFDSEGRLLISSRFDGVIYQATRSGEMSVYVEGMGVATGIAFDGKGNLYVGDRSGTIFKISPSRQIYVYATLEASISAYHLAFGAEGYLYVTGPTTSSFDAVHRISPAGEVEAFYRGLGRPQGMAFDIDENLYVAASIEGRKGIVRITPNREASLFVSGPNIVGCAFAPSGDLIVTTTAALYRVPAGIQGRPLP
ncbi:IPT/TIG domain-containing protein [uncultured Paludibaculum sp.]|uniref:SMP-30/gluconolactonase/LRE family protein n=1 Tax=uncultured Paludibaculum sp. TaxID=1765020 RepID=UPI002AAC3EEF|nr:IPT/TIG domain-containing protein [uncultured Paludibaculum sp.]